MATQDKMKTIRESAKIAEPGLNSCQLMGVYGNMQRANLTYEQILQLRGYNGPRKTAETMAECVNEGKRGAFRILDIGAGTGLVGLELYSLGFTTIDGLEPSEDLVKDAEDKDVYQTLYKCFMSGEKTPGVNDDQYDGLVTCGCFMENHLPVDELDEMVRIVKPGGVIVITTRYKYLTTVSAYRDILEPYMRSLERQGKWEMKTREIFPKYYMEDEGIVWTFVKK